MAVTNLNANSLTYAVGGKPLSLPAPFAWPYSTSFENLSETNVWSVERPATSCSRSSVVARTGTYSLAVTIPLTSTGGYAWARFSATPGRQYTISAYARATGTGTTTARIAIRNGTGSASVTAINSWSLMTGTFVALKPIVLLGLGATTPATRTLYFDDLTIS